MASAEFTINNKVHSAIKMLLFMANYGRKLRIVINIRRRRKIEKMTEFAEKIKRCKKKQKQY